MSDLHTAVLTLDSEGACYRAWVAACGAASTPPLWHRLLSAAIEGGWYDADREPRYDVLIAAARALASAAGAPAAPELEVPAALARYVTVTGTTILAAPGGWPAWDLEITGEPASVVRRMLAAARVAGVSWTPDPALLEAAEVEVGERAASLARSRLMSDVAAARPVRDYLPADEIEVEAVRPAPEAWWGIR